jgi:hypothetical protein
MPFTFRIFLCFFTLIFLLTSCSEEEKTISTEDSFASYVSNNTSTILFGKIVLKDFIDNLAFNDLPKLNVLLSKEVTTLSKGLDLKESIYYSIDSLLQKDGQPSNLILFMKVKNQDSLADKFSSLGYLIEPKEQEIEVSGENLSGKITSTLAIIHLSKKASKKTIASAFKKTEQSIQTQVKKLISKKSSFSAHLHLENMQRLLDNQSLERPISKKEELIALYKNSFIASNFHLKSDNFIGDIQFSFNASLKKRLFFESNAEKNLSLITNNDFVSGAGISINPLKADLFISDFYPNVLSNLTQNNFTLQLALLSLGQIPISNLTNGNIAFAYHNWGTPKCQIQLGNKANEIKKLSTPYLSALNIPNLHFEGNKLTNLGSQPHQYSPNSKFKKTGFYFIYESKNDTHFRTLNDGLKFLDVISTISITLNNDGGTILFKGKKKKEGLLHQIANIYIEELKKVVN